MSENLKTLGSGLGLLVLLVAIYFTGYYHGFHSKVAERVHSVATRIESTGEKIDGALESVKGFPDAVDARLTKVMEDLKKLFRFRTGADGKVYLEPNDDQTSP